MRHNGLRTAAIRYALTLALSRRRERGSQEDLGNIPIWGTILDGVARPLPPGHAQ